jgi:hypothetical protein
LVVVLVLSRSRHRGVGRYFIVKFLGLGNVVERRHLLRVRIGYILIVIWIVGFLEVVLLLLRYKRRVLII